MGPSRRNSRLRRFPATHPYIPRELSENDTTDALSHLFIEFMVGLSNEFSESGPPKKRYKASPIIESFEHILVRRSKLFVKFPNARLQKLERTLQRQQVPVWISLNEPSPKTLHIEISDHPHKFGGKLLNVTIPAENVPLQDLQIASLVAREATSSQNPSGHGRLWTETDIRLGYDGVYDFLEIVLSIKWNITTSVNQLPQRHVSRPGLQAVLAAYFPLPDESGGERNNIWSAQSFYSSVHVPYSDDNIAASIITSQVSTALYPFQKRSVRWLLEREGVDWSAVSESIVNRPTATSSKHLPYSFHQVTDANGQICYVSDLFKIVLKDFNSFRHVENLRGGILAEEMGLGKTVEIIALVSLHQRPTQNSGTILNPYTMSEVRPSPATLIITPPSILPQWMAELARHSPSLKVMHYEGIKTYKHLEENQLLDILVSYDVVITTYSILSSEIHYTLPAPDRDLRGQRKYISPRSPLIQLSWWRVCLDEAQMIESGVSNAATVARLIPRENAWAVTGTPVQKDVADLLGLLVFLRLEPFSSRPYFWSTLVSKHNLSFQSVFKQLTLRHTKQSVREELRLPVQQRYVITMPFTPIEEQHYQSLFQQMCEDCGLDLQGRPLRDDWEFEEVGVIEQMRTWLVRLRQTALHPDVGGRNRRALGHKQGPLRTVDDVLAAMLEQTEISLRTDQRALLLSQLKRGQTFENGPEVKQALAIWTGVFQEASEIVSECRDRLKDEIPVITSSVESMAGIINFKDFSDSDDEDEKERESTEASVRITTFRNRLKAALEIQHIATFFQANGYFQMKTDEQITEPGSEEFKRLERLETEGYERAKHIRQEILKEAFTKVSKLMSKLSKRAASQAFAQIPEFSSNLPRGGIESRRVMEKLNQLGIALDAQANCLDEWRERTIKLLLRPLVDEDEGLELTGDEYEESTKTQDEVLVYVRALRTLIEDRHDTLTGQENQLIKSEVKAALKLAEEAGGPFSDKVLELFRTREQVKPSKEIGSIRGIVSEFRTLATTLKIEAENGSSRATNELTVVEQERTMLQKQYNDQNKAIIALRQEVDAFTALMNSRLEYYRQLQQVSDMLAPLEDNERDSIRGHMVLEQERLVRKIATLGAKRRYLIHLRDETNADPSLQRMCVICQSSFDLGALTICGHQFCKECIGLWWNSHRNCPVCKRKLTRNDLHDITYKPQELKMTEEVVEEYDGSRLATSVSKKSTIYSEISNSALTQIKNIDLDGPSFTTKIDTLARHLLWLRDSDAGAKSIIFSQFKEFLEVLGRALATFRIGFTTIDNSGGVEKFKRDPGVECFLLHAKAHSSGLNLVNANHVFLCEPLINTAIELQAIARVHRIGQHQETTVWLYIIDGTVEESIYQISVQRRLEHLDRTGKGKAIGLTPELIENSNSIELQNAPLAKLLTKGRTGGEVVDKNDLWSCLFGNGYNKRPYQPGSNILNLEVRRQSGVDVAEKRRTEEISNQ